MRRGYPGEAMEPVIEPGGPVDAEWVVTQRRWTQGRRRPSPPRCSCSTRRSSCRRWPRPRAAPARSPATRSSPPSRSVYLATVLKRMPDQHAPHVGPVRRDVGAVHRRAAVATPAVSSFALYIKRAERGAAGPSIGAGRHLPGPRLAGGPGGDDVVEREPAGHARHCPAAGHPVVALATFGVMQVVKGNRALAEARAQLARLAAENERARIARDLHDLSATR